MTLWKPYFCMFFPPIIFTFSYFKINHLILLEILMKDNPFEALALH